MSIRRTSGIWDFEGKIPWPLATRVTNISTYSNVYVSYCFSAWDLCEIYKYTHTHTHREVCDKISIIGQLFPIIRNTRAAILKFDKMLKQRHTAVWSDSGIRQRKNLAVLCVTKYARLIGPQGLAKKRARRIHVARCPQSNVWSRQYVLAWKQRVIFSVAEYRAADGKYLISENDRRYFASYIVHDNVRSTRRKLEMITLSIKRDRLDSNAINVEFHRETSFPK
mgnify:CR=1 FL=1